ALPAQRLECAHAHQAPPPTLAKPGRGAPEHDADYQHREQIDVERQLGRDYRRFGIEGIEYQPHPGPVRHRQRNKQYGGHEPAGGPQNASDQMRLPLPLVGVAPGDFWFSLSRSSLPVLKNGTNFSCTETVVPVRGLRPTRADRCLTVNAPKPLSSTRWPRARAS